MTAHFSFFDIRLLLTQKFSAPTLLCFGWTVIQYLKVDNLVTTISNRTTSHNEFYNDNQNAKINLTINLNGRHKADQ